MVNTISRNMNKNTDTDAKVIFILPFRNRDTELNKWLSTMIPILDEQYNCIGINNLDKPYEIIIPHQKDQKLFNKGALVNSACKILLQKYGSKLMDMIMVMNDIDIYPIKSGIFDYYVEYGTARHPYGVLRPQFGGILGGLYYIRFGDFFKVGGMPNYWGWGGEDICLARRVLANGIKIDESEFIERRTTTDIIDPVSAPTLKQRRFQEITDKRNLRACFMENHLKPVNGLMNCEYNILEERYIEGFEKYENIKMYDLVINII